MNSIKELNLNTVNEHYIQNLVYAQTIQNGLLPKKRHFEKHFLDFFVYYAPQNKISGDFYWLIKKENTVYFALADCTGHGTSAAMLSVLGISLLNYIIQKKLERIGDYLTELDKKWIETFNNETHDTYFNNDWLEITLVAYNIQNKKLEYASAGGEFAVVQDNEIFLFKGNNFPIGGWQIEKNRSFDSFEIDIKKATNLYFFSDGVKHQFDENNTKKFSRKRLLNLLQNYSSYDMYMQKTMFEFVFDAWKGNAHQTDDVSLVGIKL